MKKNKLIKQKKISGWGEDLHFKLLKSREEGKNELSKILEDKILAKYLLQIRKEFETNEYMKNILINSDPATKAFPDIIDILYSIYNPDMHDIFDKAVAYILAELDDQRRKKPSLYLIDPDTGKSIMPISEKDVYKPPDYIGEDGKTHKAQPTVHPGITSSLAMLQVIKDRKKRIQERSKEAPLAYQHITDPEKIVLLTKEKLEEIGVQISVLPDIEYQIIKFGHEHTDGDLQLLNSRFHRANLYSTILTRRLHHMCSPKSKVEFGQIRVVNNNKKQWFEVEVKID
jgi:hypothetical protein